MITELFFHLDPGLVDPSRRSCPTADGWTLAHIADKYICARALSEDHEPLTGTYQQLKDNPGRVNQNMSAC